jgi:branched-chain amino acid transport system permease protein
MENVLNIIISSLIQGGIYALIAVGLNLQYGVAKVMNVSHGEFVMIGAFITYCLYAIFGINPLVSLVICGPIMLLLGFLIFKTLFQPLKKSPESAAMFEGTSMLVSFGLLYVIQNIVLLWSGTQIRAYSYLSEGIEFLGLTFEKNRLIALFFAVVISSAFYLVLLRTRIGKAIRAAAQSPTAAQLVGVNIHNVLALCFGVGAMMAGLAGCLVSMMYEITATMGFSYLIIALIVIVLGGLGNFLGSFIGGLALGFVTSTIMFIEPELTLIASYVIFALILLIRPQGILGK